MKQILSILIFLLSFTSLAESSKPNVLFILIDDLGWKDIAIYGNKIHETPNLDELAARGMRFTNAYAACPICGPSRAAIMTGKFPSNNGFFDNFVSQNKNGKLSRTETRSSLKLEEYTLAEAFKDGGYQTGFIGKWHLTNNNESHLPTDQGFDINIAGGWWGHPRGKSGFFSPYQMAHLEDGPKGEYLTDRLTTEAIQTMDTFSKKDQPWFLYMSYYTVHSPFHSKAQKTKKYSAKAKAAGLKKFNAKYAGMVDSMDENIGRLIDWLEEKKLRKNTIVVFTSDNGGMIKAHHNKPLRSYKGDLYEGGIRVSCIVDWPGVTKAGSVSDVPVSGVDFYSTLLAMTGTENKAKNLDSVNLVPVLKGDESFKRGPMVWYYPVGVPHIKHSKPGSVIRDGDWKYIHFYDDNRKELYNLKTDIGETNNLIKTNPEKASELANQLAKILKSHGVK